MEPHRIPDIREYYIARDDAGLVLLLEEAGIYQVAAAFENPARLREHIARSLERSRDNGWTERFIYDAPKGWRQISIDDIIAIEPVGGNHLRRIRDSNVPRASRYS